MGMNKVWLEREKEKHSRHVYFSFCKLTTQDAMYAVAKLHKAGGALRYFLGGYLAPGALNWHPVLKKISPTIDSPI